ncbi:alpha/beta fold hydrolase [Leptospira barantonii]|uniref:Alpha/beta hydrolase n=1 Tax=Leptospira barantonii TaxID=2023184 RepID=A0ABX4NTB8_9LEPT|nr:alpha/beta hydrolase [Leptospira barantonii]PJZ58263.1 alpha/beta hydrolase [Leptospira barantonii]
MLFRRIKQISFGILISLLSVFFLFIVLTWESDRSVDDLKERWASPPSTFITFKELNVHLRDEGPKSDPTPIVLIHGGGSSLHTWDAWTTELKSSRRVIRFDLPGFGLTGPAPDQDYSMKRYTEFLIALLDQLQIKRAILVGNSFGGNVAWRTVLEQPERFQKLILLDSGGYKTESVSVPIAFRIARIPILSNLLQNILPRKLVESSVKNTYGDPSKVTEEKVDRFFSLALRSGNRKALAQFQQKLVSESGIFENRIGELRLPTLILWGKKDKLQPPINAEKFHKDIQGSKLIVFENLGHIPQEEDPKETLNAVLDFIR